MPADQIHLNELVNRIQGHEARYCCYRGRDDGEQLTGAERVEAKQRNEEARVGSRGLRDCPPGAR